MILIYVHTTSPRLQYIAAFIFKELLKVPYAITGHSESFKEFDGVKINYSDTNITEAELKIPNNGLLHQKGIKEQTIDAFEINNITAFFKSGSANSNEYPFDIFSACFYLLSRYEEYLPHLKDKYGRYLHTNSLAYKENFLHLPLVNIWINDFSETLKKRNPNSEIRNPEFEFKPTYDVDIAYSYLHKGAYRNSGGLIRSLFTFNFRSLAERIKVLAGNKKDPFDNYDWLHQLHIDHNLKPTWFFLVADKNGKYDKNILPETEAMQNLIKQHAEKYSIGLHPSWQSGDKDELLKKEKETLETISEREINKSRCHYLRFSLPSSYRKLSEAEITDEYSMGYAGTNGFRASVANSFYWYDLEKEEQTTLKIYPFCYMDSTSIYQEKITSAQAFEEMKYYYNICKQCNGTLITIMHNHLLGNDKIEWGNVYEKFLKEIL